MKKKISIGLAFSYLLLIVISITTIFPYIWMVLSSFKSGIDISTHPEQIIPRTINFNSYVDAFRRLNLWIGIKNTLIIVFFSTTISPFVSALGAFAFSKLALPRKRLLLLTLLSSMMVPYAALMLPQFQIWQKLNLVGTLWPLIIPCFFGSVLMMFFLTQYRHYSSNLNSSHEIQDILIQ